MKKYLFAIIMSLGCLVTYAQQGFVAVGGDIKNGNGSVSFSVGQLEYNNYSDATYLIMEGLQQPYEVSGALPISLLYFNAKVTIESTVLLNWSTTSENNNDYFTIERSKDATSFEKVNSSVPSAGNSNTKQDYTLTDYQPFQGVSFYRLRQTDKDGKFTYSPIEKVIISGSQFTATASPNPTRNIVQLKIDGQTDKKLSYLLIDMNGKVLMKANITNPITQVNLGSLAHGTYILRVDDGEKVIQSFKIIKIP